MPTVLALIAILATLGTSVPSAKAYLTPDEALFSEDFGVYFAPPPSRRKLPSIVKQRNAETASSRAAAFRSVYNAQHSSVRSSSSSMSVFAPPPGLPVIQDGDNGALLTPVEERLQNRQGAYMPPHEVLHSGAPHTASTGPASILSFIVMIAAAVYTLRVARKHEHRAR